MKCFELAVEKLSRCCEYFMREMREVAIAAILY
jgi:hypothetical protein